MTRSSGFARIGLNSARWLLPLIAVLFVSLSLAYAMGSAIRGGSSTSDQSEVQAVLLRDEAAAPSDVEQSPTSLSETVMETSGGRFGVMSISSPASTGRASPNGCCTWNWPPVHPWSAY
jgi:hypothetical protein